MSPLREAVMDRNTTAPVTTPTVPKTAPVTRPERRLNPERICPDQIHRTIRRILPDLPL